jgi:class 3 adenylate cyclase
MTPSFGHSSPGFRGREVNTSGDGFLAMFDGPQRAIRCAMSIRDAVQSLGIEVRAGLHTGECEVRGDDIGGIAVHIGARVSALAGPNDVLASSTLRDLVIGSGLEFEDRGAHQLKGVPGEWRASSRSLRAALVVTRGNYLALFPELPAELPIETGR